MIQISLICPCFNEENVVEEFIDETRKTLEEIDQSFEIIFVNDGSTDGTLDKLIALKGETTSIRIINFSRNFGKEAALTAGLNLSKGELIIPIDVDLQHPPQLIKEFVRKWEEGFDVVIARRKSRATESYPKK